MLSKLHIKCEECNQTVAYFMYDSHQLTHHKCRYCSKSLKNWPEIRQHYYRDCTEFMIECDTCEFKFTRKEYAQHDCTNHYKWRMYELFASMVFLIVQTGCMGLSKSVSKDECWLIGYVQTFMINLAFNIGHAIWALAMFLNF